MIKEAAMLLALQNQHYLTLNVIFQFVFLFHSRMGIQATQNPSAMPSLTQDVNTYKDLVDGFEENLSQKPKVTMQKELAPLVTERLN